MEYLQQALDELYCSTKQRTIDKCLEEEGINDLVMLTIFPNLGLREVVLTYLINILCIGFEVIV